MSKHTTKSRSSKSSSSHDPEKKALEVMCPRCGVFPGKSCKHTKGSKKGVKCMAHEDRINLSKVKANDKTKAKLKEVDESEHFQVKPKKSKSAAAKEKLTPEQAEVVEILADKISTLGRHAEFVGPVSVGPIISTYRFFPVQRTKVAHLEGFAKDFAVALGSESIVVKRMPGESAVGVFVPNKHRKLVMFRDTLSNVSEFMQEVPSDKHLPIPLNFGIDSDGSPFVDDLTMQPHLLIAGTTGSGKSTVEHSIALGLAWTLNPRELILIISDTKGVEFKAFNTLPHLHPQFGVCKDHFETMQAMDWMVKEAQKRLDRIGQMNVRNIHEYNLIDKTHQMPYVVFIVDELNDIIGTSVEKDEAKINSQKLGTIVARSRAAGIYVIAATQRSDVRTVKGSIKANFPSRLCFRLPSHQDSRTILSTKGAENLMSRGDMFYQSSQHPELRRLHAPYTSLEDVKLVVQQIILREQQEQEELMKQVSPAIADDQKWKPTVQ
jgi:S-DNA-T family DNA segregation ATPase FtsK/SpoIIIE